MNKVVYILMYLAISFLSYGQKKGINYQAIILDPNPLDIPGNKIMGQPFQKGKVAIKFTISSINGVDYTEIQQAETDEFGLINLTIGLAPTNGSLSSNSSSETGAKYSTFDTIIWDEIVKNLAVAVSFDNGKTFTEVSNQKLSYSAYALYAESVDYKNVRDAPTRLSQFFNDPGYLISKDLEPVKADIKNNSSQIKIANQIIDDNKKSSDQLFLVINQSITSLDTKLIENSINIKDNQSSISTIITKLSEQQNQISTTNNNLNSQIGGLRGQIRETNDNVNNLSGTAEVVSNKSTEIDLGGASPSDQKYPSQKATKTYIDQNISKLVAGNIPDATTLATGKIQLAGDLSGTATNPTVPALANKENVSNKSTNIQGDAGSDSKYPSVRAVKTYVDQATMGAALQATVDAKADKNSPTFTGTPSLPSGTTAITQNSSDNSTKLATTAFVQQATAGIALQASVDAKADKNSPIFTGTPVLPSSTIAVTQSSGDNSNNIATTAFVQQAAAAGIIDASTSLKGKLKLAGDLAGTADLPAISTGAVNSDKILDGSIVTADLADASVTDIKITTITGSKVTGNISGNAANVSGIVAVANGGTGASTKISGFNALSPMTTKGDLIYGENFGEGTRLPKGNEGQVLTMKTGVPSWQNPRNNNSDDDDDDDEDDDGDDGTIRDADSDTKGILRLSGDLSGTASSPAVATGAINSAKILDGSIATVDLANASVTDVKIAGVAGSKVTGNISGNAANVNGIVAVLNGGTGTSTLTGYVKGTGTSALSASSSIPVADVTGAAPINSPAFTGTPSLPTGTTAITQTSADNSTKLATTAFVQLVTSAGVIDASATEKGKLKLAGDLAGTADLPIVPGLALKANITTLTSSLALKEDAANKSNAALGTSTTLFPTQNAVKIYVDAQSVDASSSVRGRIQLTGDLTGSATSPVIATGAINSAKILDGSIATGDLANASVTDIKIAGVAGSKVTGNISGNAANVSGTVGVPNGGTGATTLSSNHVLLGNGTNAIQTVAPGTSGNVLMSNGATWVSASNNSDNNTHAIGELYGGGIIFYVYDGGKHGLIASASDQSNDIKWGLDIGKEIRAQANGIGAGIKNTTIIISSEISQRNFNKSDGYDGENFAALICNEFVKSETINSLETTYGDWYLPSKYELNLLYLNRNIVGNFASDIYWSSTEYDDEEAWTINFNTRSGSAESKSDKSSKNRVRAIRNF